MVVARTNGKETGRQIIRTSGQPYAIRLTTDYIGKDTYFVNAEVVDKEGNLCTTAENDIVFSSDNAEIIGVDNGSQFSTERFKANHRKAFFGRCLVVLKSKSPNPITLRARSIGLADTQINL